MVCEKLTPLSLQYLMRLSSSMEVVPFRKLQKKVRLIIILIIPQTRLRCKYKCELLQKFCSIVWYPHESNVWKPKRTHHTTMPSFQCAWYILAITIYEGMLMSIPQCLVLKSLKDSINDSIYVLDWVFFLDFREILHRGNVLYVSYM